MLNARSGQCYTVVSSTWARTSTADFKVGSDRPQMANRRLSTIRSRFAWSSMLRELKRGSLGLLADPDGSWIPSVVYAFFGTPSITYASLRGEIGVLVRWMVDRARR